MKLYLKWGLKVHVWSFSISNYKVVKRLKIATVVSKFE